MSFKIRRFVDCNTAYPVEVSVCGRQLREPLFPHTGHDKGIVRQQPFARPNLGACLHNVERERENGEVHVGNFTHVVLILGELFDHLWGFPKLPDSRSGRDEPCRDGFGHHAAVQHFCKDRRGRVAEQCATGTALQQGFTFQGAPTKVVDKNIGVNEHGSPSRKSAKLIFQLFVFGDPAQRFLIERTVAQVL